MDEIIKLIHGDGGKHTSQLIEEIFYKNFQNKYLLDQGDAATFQLGNELISYTTDSFVVKPIFFRGGNIGKLAVCGTVNDLVVSGATPLYLSTGFIIEEGFERKKLEKIVETMRDMCTQANVSIVTGDTKVVEKGSLDEIVINTSGVGVNYSGYKKNKIDAGDKILITGGIGEHGTTIAVDRYHMKISGDYQSDCALLTPFLSVVNEYKEAIKCMRDPTRGGVATVLHEFMKTTEYGICLYEEEIPIKPSIRAVNKLLGFDPLYMACEGRMVLVVKREEADKVLRMLQSIESGKDTCIIGEFAQMEDKMIYSRNSFGGKRIIPELVSSILPRIC
ncbi:hydrogenase expression/formation protein HypE [Anaeromicropila herbilytica]|uniref:Hydrogenase expression/formation protein HypE n=1 Tax=Anaeromicropila herbilytica TaxID=2785025 RepID=A0A7R7ELZ5_9FIRM|nr:hydrogenase expression/formation protein HypE [Anaeromicropila herbilytica]BCN31242.1 hydrogenase expression/formation protein HypE [Anaeromicropila herbilytica]